MDAPPSTSVGRSKRTPASGPGWGDPGDPIYNVSNLETPSGISHYDALQVTHSLRWSLGLNVLTS